MKQKYLIVLSDDPSHFHEFFASSVEEAKRMVINSDVPEDKIESITLAPTEQNLNSGEVSKIKNPFTGEMESVILTPTEQNLNSGKVSKIKNPFTGEMEIMNGEVEQIKSSDDSDNINQNVNTRKNQNNINNETSKIFMLNGVEVKIIDGVMYKKDWVDVPFDQYRLVNIKTGRITKSTQIILQRMDWIPVPQVDESVIE